VAVVAAPPLAVCNNEFSYGSFTWGEIQDAVPAGAGPHLADNDVAYAALLGKAASRAISGVCETHVLLVVE
jgi:hypothetical protein